MQKRLFISILLPLDLKKKLIYQAQKNYRYNCIRWIALDNLHLTLNFLGNVKVSELKDLCEEIKYSLEKTKSFEIEFNSIGFGPTKENIKMIWAKTKASVEALKLNKKLNQALDIKVKKNKFIPHVTLARIKKGSFLGKVEKNEIQIEGLMEVNEIHLMESKVEKGSRYYYKVATFKLK